MRGDVVRAQSGGYHSSGDQAAAGRSLPEISVATLADDGSDAADTVRGWVADGGTAVPAWSDEMAFVVQQGIRGAGVLCTRDLAVVGVNAGVLGGVCELPVGG